MRIAIKFSDNDTFESLYPGYEAVLYRKQMLVDVFHHEYEPLPSFEDFLSDKGVTRGRDEKFWVYRQGAFLDEGNILHGALHIGYAKTEDLDASPEPNFEQYHHVPTMIFGGGEQFKMFGQNPLRVARQQMAELYNYVRDYGKDDEY